MNYEAIWRRAYERAEDMAQERELPNAAVNSLALQEFLTMALPEHGPWFKATVELTDVLSSLLPPGSRLTKRV